MLVTLGLPIGTAAKFIHGRVEYTKLTLSVLAVLVNGELDVVMLDKPFKFPCFSAFAHKLAIAGCIFPVA